MNPVSLRDILKGARDVSGPMKGIALPVLRQEFERVSTRRLKVQSAVFLCLMGIGALVPNLEHMVGGINGPRAILLMLVIVGFPLSWWVQGRHAASWNLEKKTQWARRYAFGNLVSMAAALGVILFSVLASVGILPLPSKGAILVSSLVSVPVLALALHYAERKLSRLLDADWLE